MRAAVFFLAAQGGINTKPETGDLIGDLPALTQGILRRARRPPNHDKPNSSFYQWRLLAKDCLPDLLAGASALRRIPVVRAENVRFTSGSTASPQRAVGAAR
ncbi:MAG: hypothetical protein GY789_17435 [Hyphomicrobiales bacterium]|nr:hypothetical protein [Hyphomicrobiales bacterium]